MVRIRGIIYIITNQINGKQYVGQTKTHKKIHGIWYKYGIIKRFTEHVGSARREKTTPIARSIADDGSDVFDIEELERCSVDMLNIRESHYIQEYNTLVPNGYNVQCQSGQVINDNYEKIIMKGIRRNGDLSFVRLYVYYSDHVDRINFHGDTFVEALDKARKHVSNIDPIRIHEHPSLVENTNGWWLYKEKIDQFENRKVNRIRVCLFGTQNLIRVQIRTDDMKSWKDEVRLVFGGKKIELIDAFTTALAVVSEIENRHGVQHDLDPRLLDLCQSLQQVVA